MGEIEAMHRGRLNWLITIASDGSLSFQGVAPMRIQWPDGVQPAAMLPESGCALVRLEGFHPEAGKIMRTLDATGFEGNFHVSSCRRSGRLVSLPIFEHRPVYCN